MFEWSRGPVDGLVQPLVRNKRYGPGPSSPWTGYEFLADIRTAVPQAVAEKHNDVGEWEDAVGGGSQVPASQTSKLSPPKRDSWKPGPCLPSPANRANSPDDPAVMHPAPTPAVPRNTASAINPLSRHSYFSTLQRLCRYHVGWSWNCCWMVRYLNSKDWESLMSTMNGRADWTMPV